MDASAAVTYPGKSSSGRLRGICSEMKVLLLGTEFYGPFLEKDCGASIVSSTEQQAIIKFDNPISIGGRVIEFAVAQIRGGESKFSELPDAKMLSCNVTATTREIVYSENPFDLTWWRGGNSAITDLVFVASDEAKSS